VLGAYVAFQVGVMMSQYGGVDSYLDSRKEGQKLRRALSLINGYYVNGDPVELDDLSRNALNGMLSKLDPYSEYFDAKDYERFDEDHAQEFGGIGVQIEVRDGNATVITPIEDGPSIEAGIVRGDRIVKVDDEEIKGESVGELVDRLRGKVGSVVKVGVFRPSSEETLEFDLKRAKIEVHSVKDAQLYDGDIGYARVTQFGRKSAIELFEAIEKLQEEGMKGLVIDLRNNPGGLLDVAVEMVEPFVGEGQLIVYTEGRDESFKQKWISEYDGDPYVFPVVVLINPGSASASEIVAGALKDTGRATVIGETSFGKGLVQSVLPLGDGAYLKLTTSKYYTPGGYVIDGNGIEPNVEVALSPEDDRKLAIQRQRLKFMSEEEFVERFEFEPMADMQLQTALDAARIDIDKLAGLAK